MSMPPSTSASVSTSASMQTSTPPQISTPTTTPLSMVRLTDRPASTAASSAACTSAATSTTASAPTGSVMSPLRSTVPSATASAFNSMHPVSSVRSTCALAAVGAKSIAISSIAISARTPAAPHLWPKRFLGCKEKSLLSHLFVVLASLFN